MDSLKEVLDSIDGKYDIIRNYDANKFQYFDPNVPSFFNTLHYLAAGYGYWIHMNDAGTLILSGALANPSDSLTLNEGWNLIGCWSQDAYYNSNLPPTVDLPAQVNLVKRSQLIDVLQAVHGKYSIVKSIDANGSEFIYDVNVPSFLNSLHYFIGPGYGYWIKMNEPALFNYSSFSVNEKYQHIYLIPGDIDTSIGETFTLSVMYHVRDGNKNLSGVGIRIHYDSSRLSYINCTNIAPQNVSTPIEKAEEPMNSDLDPDTDRMLIIAWADSNDGFPGQELPYKLADITFQVKTDVMPGNTSINTGFTAVASGYDVESENAVVHIASTPEDHADHFIFSAPSINRTMVIYGDVFTIDDEVSEIGDEIAVFNQEGTMCGHYVITHPGYFILIVYGNDLYSSEDEGANTREDLVFKVWDASDDVEITLDNTMFIQKDVFDKSAIENVPPRFEEITRGMGIAAVTLPSIEQIGRWFTLEDKAADFSFHTFDTNNDYSNLSIIVKTFCPDVISSLSYTQNNQQSLQTFSIIPVENQYGTCPIAITVTDYQSTLSESFMLSIYAVDDPPEILAIPDQKITDDTLISEIDFLVNDIDSDPGNIQISAKVSNPIIVPESNIFIDGDHTNRHLRIYPTTREMGNVLITITAVSNHLTDTTTFTLAFNTPPESKDSAIKLDEDESLNIPLSANDTQNDPLTYTIVEFPKHGTLIHNNADKIVAYKPFPDYHGLDIFSFKANDGYADSNIAQIVLTIKSINDPPVARDLTFQTSENTVCPIFSLIQMLMAIF
ncbi:MAG: hypothetical protein OMM_04494 [Candidatus Magnetoglobus multicellularis str. Araruama]|uniref:RapA2 cadherin-like domain-containing protein n=1 Tax=Candidatus Magnetoglobus multicellularis str. Araruama TaxID=890399 RepID=A0A1V1P165_9BACT|nr:MAG: hypothetical protein OMM_04494 [Candidatus Magnetoglobus multicellularis str. Araruama]